MISPAREEEYPMDSSPKAVLFPEVDDRCPSITTDIEICQCQMTRKNDIARTCIWNLYLPSKVNDCSTSITVNMDICQRHVTRNDVTKTLGKEVSYGLLSKRYAWCTDLTLAIQNWRHLNFRVSHVKFRNIRRKHQCWSPEGLQVH